MNNTGKAAKTGRVLRAGGEGALIDVVDGRAVRLAVAAGEDNYSLIFKIM